ncbi:phosphoribosylanthranilate isomerase [Lutibacter sp. B1]|uniref:phosphoribosylanthranilate isomerase n=1 Tax=Lutibacter sp. B1 TaxID=2725996 RepID=UPI001456DA02|nr:phosphoribosylanthranilate isomerase [Lutibacter sp. B1]NLP59113.1 phosphoribosylanthranilate isomerase [Lutibacter sp. B1]
MKIKVCGMRDIENISNLLVLKPDFIGFIFYEKSKRFIKDIPQIDFPKKTKKVGVFVNESIENVIDKINKFQLNLVQLHGSESPEYCRELRHSELISESHSFEIIKAFSVDEKFNFSATIPYNIYCKYFLFDTKGENYGGNGVKFNWNILQNYKGETPFLLSGGIAKNDVKQILSFLRRHESKRCIGIDINSGFEIEPGLKNLEDIKEFKNNLK